MRQGSQAERVSSATSNAAKVKQHKGWEGPLDLATWRRWMGAVDRERCVVRHIDKEGEKQGRQVQVMPKFEGEGEESKGSEQTGTLHQRTVYGCPV